MTAGCMVGKNGSEGGSKDLVEIEGNSRKGMQVAVSHKVFLAVDNARKERKDMAEQLPRIKCPCGPSEQHSSQAGAPF